MSPPRHALVVLVLGVALGGSACQRTTQARQAARAGVLLVGNPTEPKSLDPHLATGKSGDAILAALFEGLATDHPTDSDAAMPGAAERWEHNADLTEWTFHLRRNAEWSDGAPVTAHDFTFAFHRILAPPLAAPQAGMLHCIHGAEDYSRNRRGYLLCGRDPGFPVPWNRLQRVNFGGHADSGLAASSTIPDFPDLTEQQRRRVVGHRGLDSLTAAELEWIAADPSRRFDWPPDLPAGARDEVLRRLISRNGDDLWEEAEVGVETVDDFTLRLRLREPVAFLPALTRHHAWFPVPRHVVLQHGKITGRCAAWSTPANLVGNGPFKIKSWRYLDSIEVERNPCYWDAASVKLNGIRFLAIEGSHTQARAFLAGQLHATAPLPPDLLDLLHDSHPDCLREDSTMKHHLHDPAVRGWQPLRPGVYPWKSVFLAN